MSYRKNTASTSAQVGFTLVELVVVIVILGILAVTALPRFIDISDDARDATHQAIAAAFRDGVNLTHITWQIRGNRASIEDLIDINFDGSVSGLNMNEFGYPVNFRDSDTLLNERFDCADVWRAALQIDVGDSPSVAAPSSAANIAEDIDYRAVYNGDGTCSFFEQPDETRSITYNPSVGEITVTL